MNMIKAINKLPMYLIPMNIFQRKLLCYSSYSDSYTMNCKYDIEFLRYFMSELILLKSGLSKYYEYYDDII